MRLQIGDRYAEDFTVVRELGRGAFSTVYEVVCERYEKSLALKLSHEPIAQGEVAQRALREVTIQKGAESSAVAKIYEHGLRVDGHFYVLMDLIEGAALDNFWTFGRKMEPALALRIAMQVCAPLDLLHEHQIVHRDIKPGNIVIEAQTERVFLVDFGLARSWNETEVHGITATLGHKLVGTPHYAQPEQVEGTPLTPAADVYSLAVILYELITGYTPLDRDDDFATMRDAWRETPIRWITAHVRAPYVPATKHVPELAPHVESALRAALAKDAADRPQRAADFAALLRGE